MARKPRAREPSLDPSVSASDTDAEQAHDSHDEDKEGSPPTSINPYTILSIPTTATPAHIKSAYRKAALQHHPDKAGISHSAKTAAHNKFQEIAFAYAILSDEARRRRYDATGNTAESLEGEDGENPFDWVDFFRSQSEEMMTLEAMEKFKAGYQGSEEETEDLLKSYTEAEGNLDAVFESVMCCSIEDDEERFRGIIDEAIKQEKVHAYPAYVKESERKKRRRREKAKAEADEAMELAEELGVKEKLFGSGGGKKKGSVKSGEDSLKALIQQRQKGRAETFLDGLEAKYGDASQAKARGKRKVVEEPPEELFAKNRKRVKGKA